MQRGSQNTRLWPSPSPLHVPNQCFFSSSSIGSSVFSCSRCPEGASEGARRTSPCCVVVVFVVVESYEGCPLACFLMHRCENASVVEVFQTGCAAGEHADLRPVLGSTLVAFWTLFSFISVYISFSGFSLFLCFPFDDGLFYTPRVSRFTLKVTTFCLLLSICWCHFFSNWTVSEHTRVIKTSKTKQQQSNLILDSDSSSLHPRPSLKKNQFIVTHSFLHSQLFMRFRFFFNAAPVWWL